MPRRSENGQTKRQREKRIQGWFDTTNADHQFILDTVAHWQTQNGMTQQEIIREGIYALLNSGQYNAPVPMPVNTNLMQSQVIALMSMVNELLNIVRTGGIAFSGQAQATLDRVQREYEELTPIEKSVAGGYRTSKRQAED